MKIETEITNKVGSKMDDLLDALEERKSTASDKAVIESGAIKGRFAFADYEDYFAQSRNLPACYEAEFYPAIGQKPTKNRSY